jgi:putative tricarboxylic transport membrane protein
VLGRDGVAGLICLAGSLGLLALTRGLPQPALVPVGPGFYPRIVLTATAVLAALLVLSDLLSRRRRARGVAARAARPNYRLVLLSFAVFAAYVFLLPLLGYRIATFLFVAVLQVVLRRPHGRGWIWMVVIAASAAILTHLVFERYLSVLLPRGRWTGM